MAGHPHGGLEEIAQQLFSEVMGLEETRSGRDVAGFALPDGTAPEV